jgi:Ca2+:H+ antiporter
VVPTAFVKSGAAGSAASNESAAVSISRGTAVVLLICYAAYLFFQLYTHKYLYTLEASKVNAKATFDTANIAGGIIAPEKGQRVFHTPSIMRRSMDKKHESETAPAEGNPSGGSEETAVAVKDSSGLHKKSDDPIELTKKESEEEEEEEEEPLLRVWIAILLLVVVTVITGVTAEFLVSSINGMTTKSGVNKEFVALILLPLVGNAAEHVTAVTVSVKNKLGKRALSESREHC